MQPHLNEARAAGITLVEVLTVTAAAAVLATVFYTSYSDLSEKLKTAKLARDVETINRAIELYEVSGGTMDGIYPHPWWVLGKLKGRVDADAQDESTGFTGNLVDSRLQPVFMNANERQSGKPRARWNPVVQRFEILTHDTETGVHIRAFKLTNDNWIDDIVTEYFVNWSDERSKRAFNYASTDGWVWDYDDGAGPSAGSEPTLVALSSGEGTPTAAGAPAGKTQLDPPSFNPGHGNYALSNFPVGVSLSNPNDAAVSEIWYSTSLGSWVLYDGSPIAVSPGEAIQAFARATDTANYFDSEYAYSAYETEPVTLAVGVTGPVSVTWMEAGGAVEPGGPAATPAADGMITLANEGDIPDGYESSSNFKFYWTVDGSDPKSSGTRSQSGPFTGGFGGESVGVGIGAWGSQTSLPIQVAALSENGRLFLDSAVETHTVGIAPTALREPSVSFFGEQVTIALETSYGDMPQGARIYYTTDGTDPGEVGGEPVSGTLYTGPFTVDLTTPPPLGTCVTEVTVAARVYPPSGYGDWFAVSDAAQEVGSGSGPDPGSVGELVCDFRGEFCQYGWFTTGDVLTANAAGAIGGDVGVGPGGHAAVTAGTATGSRFRDATATGDADEILDLSGARNAAFDLNDGFGALAATQTFHDLEDGEVVWGTASDGINVIEVDEIKVNSTGTLFINGDPDDWFIINVSDRFTLNGNATVGGTADPSKVLFNILPSVFDVKLNGQGNSISGSILAPNHLIDIQGGGELGGQAITFGGNLGINSRIRHDYSFGGCE